MRKILRASALSLLLTLATPIVGAAGVIFNVNQSIGVGSVTGTITTDGTPGPLASANVVDWALTLSDGAVSFALTGANSQVAFALGAALSETATQLLFDTANGGIVLFQAPFIGSGKDWWCLGNPAGGCFGLPGTENLRIEGAIEMAPWQGIVAIGTTDANVPPLGIQLPATLIMLGLGFGALMFFSARQAEKQVNPLTSPSEVERESGMVQQPS